MPITFTIDSAKNTVHTTITGALLDADPVEYMSAVLDHPDYRQGLSALVVCRDVRLGTFSSPAIRRLVEFSRGAEPRLDGTCVAIVADQPAVYGMARMYQLLRDAPYELRVFRELEQAEAWLGSRDLRDTL